MRMKWLWLSLFLLYGSAVADDSVLVTALEGDVRLESGKIPLEAFMRLNSSDRLILPAGSRATLVYLSAGRQEKWLGAGIVLLSESESKIVGGKPQLQAQQLPPALAKQLGRMPTVNQQGKVGMIRLRSIATAEAVPDIEKRYQEMRTQAVAGDFNAELYLLSALLEIKAIDRLETELDRLKTAHPGAKGFVSLYDLYQRAIANLRQPTR